MRHDGCALSSQAVEPLIFGAGLDEVSSRSGRTEGSPLVERRQSCATPDAIRAGLMVRDERGVLAPARPKRGGLEPATARRDAATKLSFGRRLGIEPVAPRLGLDEHPRACAVGARWLARTKTPPRARARRGAPSSEARSREALEALRAPATSRDTGLVLRWAGLHDARQPGAWSTLGHVRKECRS